MQIFLTWYVHRQSCQVPWLQQAEVSAPAPAVQCLPSTAAAASWWHLPDPPHCTILTSTPAIKQQQPYSLTQHMLFTFHTNFPNKSQHQSCWHVTCIDSLTKHNVLVRQLKKLSEVQCYPELFSVVSSKQQLYYSTTIIIYENRTVVHIKNEEKQWVKSKTTIHTTDEYKNQC